MITRDSPLIQRRHSHAPTLYSFSSQLLPGEVFGFVERLLPPEEHSAAEQKALTEEGVKAVFIMQFMDARRFDAAQLAKCRCRHLRPSNRLVPSCGYGSFPRQRDACFA